MTLDLILALVGAALTCVIVFFGILHSLGTAHHVLNLEQLGQLGFWASRYECIEPHDVNCQALIFINGGVGPSLQTRNGKIACECGGINLIS